MISVSNRYNGMKSTSYIYNETKYLVHPNDQKLYERMGLFTMVLYLDS